MEDYEPTAVTILGVHDIGDNAHGVEVLRRLQNNKWCDITIFGTNMSSFTGIRAHKMILASASSYFREAFESEAFIDSGSEEFHVEIDHAILQIIINFIYTSVLRVTGENSEALLKLMLIGADHLQMAKLVHLCGQRLVTRYMGKDCAIDKWLFARKYHCKVMENVAVLAIALDLKTIAKQNDFFELKKKDVMDLLKLLGETAAESPLKADLVCEAAIAWLNYSQAEREVDCDKVMRQVPLKLMSLKGLQRVSGASFLSEHVLWTIKLLYEVRAESTKKSKVGRNSPDDSDTDDADGAMQ